MMELSICEGDYGLASIDSDCLRLLLLSKITKIPLDIKSKQSYYPILVHGHTKLTNPDDAAKYIQKIGFSADISLKRNERYESYIFSRMIHYYLSPIIKYVWWINEFNYENFTSKWLMSSGKFPFNITGLRRMRNDALEYMKFKYPNEQADYVKSSLLKDFENCCPVFTSRLSKSKYFYGDKISTIDVLIYSYIAPLLKIPFPENEFKEMIESHPVLIRYVININEVYFPEIRYTEKYIKTLMFDEELQSNLFSVVLFGVLASMAMVGMTLSKYIKKNEGF